MLANQGKQLRRSMRPERLAVGQQHVERAVTRQKRQQFAQRATQLLNAGNRRMGLGQLLHQPTKSALAVGVAHGPKSAVQTRVEVNQVAVVRKHPVATPQLAHEGVRVL